jgi:hypothetical protein
MRERFRLREITVVADRGMVSRATLEAFEKSDPPLRYIVGVRMRRQKEVNTSVLGSRARWFESVPERSNAKDPAPLKVKEVWVKEREGPDRGAADDFDAALAEARERGVSRAAQILAGPDMLSGSAFAKFIGVSREAVRAKHQRATPATAVLKAATG